MTPRENFIHFLKHDAYERTPTFNDQIFFHPQEIPDHIARAMVFQQTPYEGPLGGKDMFGVDWIYVPSVGGSMEAAPVFDDICDWESYVTFPDLDTLIDWEGCAARNAEYLNTDKLLHTSIYTGYFERLISFVGFENAAIALIDEDSQASVHKLFDRLTELYIELTRRLKKWFDIDILELHDDWGNQRSLLFSAASHTEMVLPYVKRVVAAAHEMGVLVEQHSCGKIEALLPNIISSGADTWRGQSNAVDKKLLVDTYGDRFRFGVELQMNPGADAAQGLDAVSDFLRDYHGKDIWLTPCRAENTPAMDRLNEAVFSHIAEIGHI